jgi:N-acetylglucosamine kinase
MSLEKVSRFVLGLDGGGSRTVCVILNREGKEIGRGVGGPSNHQSVGVEAASQAITDAIQSASENAGKPAITAACWGMAGLDRPEDEQIIQDLAQTILPGIPVEIVHDSTIALVGGTGGKRVGVVIIAGTGSIAVGYHSSGQIARTSGWGHLLGDEGSGYDIALRGLNVATRAYDGRGPATSLVDLLPRAVDLVTLEELASRIYLENWTAPEIAALAPVVLSAAQSGDKPSIQIVEHAASELALAAQVVVDSLDMVSEPLEIILSGGIFQGSAMVVAEIRRVINEAYPHAEVHLPMKEPVIGAGYIALDRVNKMSFKN